MKLTDTFEIKPGGAPYVIAEIGANHNGDMDLAKTMIDSAKKSGAHAVKFQSWTPESLISKGEYASNQSYDDSPKKHFGSLHEMVSKYYLRQDQHIELKKYCDQIEIDFCSTPFSIAESDLLQELNVPFFKIASMDINNLPLLQHVAKFGKPVILSTGMSTLGEIEQAVRVVKEAGNENVVLLHCIAVYPPEVSDIHLKNIPMLQEAFNCPVGFSDHSIGFSIPLASVALGACIIEKHFTTDKDLEGWDHEISADPYEMQVICQQSEVVAQALGNSHRTVSIAEQEKKKKFRRSIVINADLDAGQKITREMIEFKRPGTGISPDQLDVVVGRTLKYALRQDDLVDWESLV